MTVRLGEGVIEGEIVIEEKLDAYDVHYVGLTAVTNFSRLVHDSK